MFSSPCHFIFESYGATFLFVAEIKNEIKTRKNVIQTTNQVVDMINAALLTNLFERQTSCCVT